MDCQGLLVRVWSTQLGKYQLRSCTHAHICMDCLPSPLSTIECVLLPGIVDLIGERLSPHDVSTSRLVSTLWRAAFTACVPSLTLVLPCCATTEAQTLAASTELDPTTKPTRIPRRRLPGPMRLPPRPLLRETPCITLLMDDSRLALQQGLLERGTDPWLPLLQVWGKEQPLASVGRGRRSR